MLWKYEKVGKDKKKKKGKQKLGKNQMKLYLSN